MLNRAIKNLTMDRIDFTSLGYDNRSLTDRLLSASREINFNGVSVSVKFSKHMHMHTHTQYMCAYMCAWMHIRIRTDYTVILYSSPMYIYRIYCMSW